MLAIPHTGEWDGREWILLYLAAERVGVACGVNIADMQLDKSLGVDTIAAMGGEQGVSFGCGCSCLVTLSRSKKKIE